MILPKSEIRRLIEKEQMITYYKDLESQLQPNGFDLTIDEIFSFTHAGEIGIEDRYIPKGNPVEKDRWNIYNLDGLRTYLFSVNETVHLPLDVCAISVQRSSIMRCGAISNIGFWDSGYNGKGSSTLNVINEYGIRIEKNARIIQMVFMKNISVTDGYNGKYQNEGIK